MRNNPRKDEDDRRDPGRAPLPPEHPALSDTDNVSDELSGRDSLENGPPTRNPPR
jgi:hypothetical protein